MSEGNFGRYEIIGEIGRGGMGTVYRAHDTKMQREVAVKVLRPELVSVPGYVERFRREAFTAGRLSEPHVMPVHEADEIDGRLFLVMPLIAGTDLTGVLVRDGAMAPARAVHVVEQVGAALDAAHSAGLVHRDVKPSNVLLTDKDFAYLIDFGIAHAASETKLTATGMTMGTWGYMAPERFTTGAADASGDIYALACVLYQCLTGVQPFPGESMPQQVHGHCYLEAPRPSAVNPELPEALDAVIARGMAKDPAQRYQTCEALVADARRVISHPSTTGRSTPAAVSPMRETMPASLYNKGPHVAETQAALGNHDRVGEIPAVPDARVGTPRGDNRRRWTVLLTALAAGLATAIVLGAVFLTRDRAPGPAAAQTHSTSNTNGTVSSSGGPATAMPADSVGHRAVEVVSFTQVGKDVSVRLHNPNSDVGLVRSPYEATLLDSEGAIIATQGQQGLPGTYVNTIFQLPPNSDYGLTMDVPEGKTVASVELLTRGPWLDWKTVNSPTVNVTSPAIKDPSSTNGPQTTGRIEIDKDGPSDVLVTAFINTSRGVVINHVFVDCVTAGQPRAFEIGSYMPSVSGPFEIDSIIAYPMEVEGAPGWHPATC